MQVNATLIAAQQAAREAQAEFRARLQQGPAAPAGPAASSFAAALGDFSPSPKPAAASQAPQATPSAPMARMGSLLDIKV